MQTLHLYEQRTFAYMPGWSSLDRSTFAATVRMTPPRVVREAEDYDDGGTYLAHIRAPAGAPNLVRAIESTLSGSNCRHEYDCCGCASRRARAKRIGRRDYVVSVSTSFNY